VYLFSEKEISPEFVFSTEAFLKSFRSLFLVLLKFPGEETLIKVILLRE